MRSDEPRIVLVTLAAVGLCLLSLSLGAAGTGGAATPLDGNETNTTLTETVENTTDSTTDTVENTTDTVTETVDSTTDTVTDTTDTGSETIDSTTDTVTDTTDSTTDTVTDTTDQTSEAVTNTTDSTTDSTSLLTVDGDTNLLTTESPDSTDGGSSDDSETGTSDGETDSGDSDTRRFSDELTDVTGTLTDGLTDTTTTAVSGVTETTATVVGEDGLLTTATETLVTGSSLTTTDGSTLTALDDTPETPTGDSAGETGSTPAGTAGPASTPPSAGTAAAVEEPTPAPAGGDGVTGTLASLTSRDLSASIPVTGRTAAGAGLAVGAAAAAGTVLLRGSSFTGTGVGRNTLRVARYGGRSAVRRAGASALDRLLRIATFFRYSQYDDSDPLENEARAAVMGAVEADPGRPITEVAEAADVNLSTARYHVRVLQKEDMLMRVPVRGRKRLFPAFTQDPELLAALSDEATAPIVDALEELEPASVGDLADELEKSPSTVTHHLQRLEEDGVVVRERDGRSVKNSLAPTAREALAPAADAEVEAEPTPAAQSAD